MKQPEYQKRNSVKTPSSKEDRPNSKPEPERRGSAKFAQLSASVGKSSPQTKANKPAKESKKELQSLQVEPIEESPKSARKLLNTGLLNRR